MVNLDRVPSATKPEQASDAHETTAQVPDESEKPEAIEEKTADESKAADEQQTSDNTTAEERQPSPTPSADRPPSAMAETEEGRISLHEIGGA